MTEPALLAPAAPAAFTVLPRVHVVKPLQRAEPTPATTLLDPAFSRALDYKLRRLKQREAARRARRPEPPDADGEDERPRFVTTVRAGMFLPPPPARARLLHLETLYPQLYSYCSQPAAVPPRRAPRAAPAAPAVPAAAARSLRQALLGVRALAYGVAAMRAGDAAAPANTMHDKRVVRGSTFAAHPHAAGDGGASAAARVARTRRRALAARAAAARLRPGTPPPAPGRKHHPIQTDYYLEELFDKGAELEVGVQTDLLADRPATPRYVPARTGADAATQIFPGDLFDFETEVSGAVSGLVGRAAAAALREAAREEELAALREQQRRFRERRDAERAERDRLAAVDQRLHAEKERRVVSARAAAAAAQEARARAAAALLARGYVAELLPAALAGLRAQGYLQDKLHTGVEEEFVPWLTAEVARELEATLRSQDLLSELVRDVVGARAALAGAAGATAAARVTPPDSLTPPSEPEEAEEEEPE